MRTRQFYRRTNGISVRGPTEKGNARTDEAEKGSKDESEEAVG